MQVGFQTSISLITRSSLAPKPPRGEALVAVPLLALLMPIIVAARVAVIASITVAWIVIAQDWHKVYVRSAARLVIPTMLGIPLGLLALRTGAEPLIKAAGLWISEVNRFCLLSLPSSCSRRS